MNNPHDDESTVIRPIGGLALPTASAEQGNALPVGSFLNEFEITRVLGEGGFGIVYLVWDHTLERRVALKEYMPSALAMRAGGSQVVVKSERHRDTFAAGLKSFINEARLLAQFDHPSLVKVYRFWEASGTAYMVMPFIEGKTLKDTLREFGSPPEEDWLMALLSPLTEALQVLHAENCFHRDIAPDNILLLAGSGLPLLLDFGAARRVIGDMTQALTVILKPGYAPIEQYAEVPSMRQGPWTDVYALAAVVYFAITGRTPPASVGRLVSDDYQPLAALAAGRYSEHLVRAVDRALQVRPDDRTPSVDAFRVDLGLVAQAAVQQGMSTTLPRPPPAAPLAKPAASHAAAPTRRGPLWLGVGMGVGVLAALGLAGTLLMGRSEHTAPTRAAAADKPTPPPAAPRPAAPPSAGLPPAGLATAGTQAVAQPVTQGSAASDIVAQFNQVVATQTAGFEVSAEAERSRLRIDVDELRFQVSSSRDGYVYVLLYGPDQVLSQIYPNAKVKTNRIKAHQRLKLPQSTWPLKASEPAGMEHFLVLVTTEPRSYASITTQTDGFYGFRVLPSSSPTSGAPAGPSWLLGLPDCGRPECSDDHGAAVFSVEAVK